MRQGSGARRGRGRGNSNNRKPNRNQSFDSNGPSVRIRGTAAQLQEKYLSLARDATSAGDRVMAENYFQHADHYYRILAAQQTPQDQQQSQQSHQSDRNDDSDDDNDTQPYNGGEQRRSQNGQMRDTDPRARAAGGNNGHADDDDADDGPSSDGQSNYQRSNDQRSNDRRANEGRANEGRSKDQRSNDGQPPLDEGLHRMLGGDAGASDEGDNRPARGRRGQQASDNGDAEQPAPRRRRRKAAPEGDEETATEPAE